MDHYINLAHQVYAYLLSIPTSSYYTFGLIVGGAIASSGIVELYKRHYNVKKQEQLAKHVTAYLLTAASFVFTFAAGLIQYGSVNPNFLGSHTLQVVGFAFVIYHFGASAGYKKIAKTVGSWVSDASSYKQEVSGTPAAPVEPVVTPVVDPLI
jgi:hypothetical protein